ncbi:MAG TPA: hypothetical protein VGC89_17215 [Pyrinomonadaceae bacterium]
MPSEELEKGLRDEVENYLNLRLSALQEEITRLQSQVNEAFTRLLERSADATQTDTSVAIAISEHMRAAHERGIEAAAAESTRTKASSDIALLKAAIDELDDQRSQTDILSALVNTSASFAPRVAFFVIKNDEARGWRARGLQGTVGDDAVRQISLPLSSETLLSDVVRSRATWGGAPGHNADDHLLTNKLGSEPPQRMVAVPLVVRERAVAVLYADSAGLQADAINLEALETLVRVAGMAVELLAVSRPAPSSSATLAEQPAAQPHAEETPAVEATEIAATEEAEETPTVEAEAEQPAEAIYAAPPAVEESTWSAASPVAAEAAPVETPYDPDATLIREATPLPTVDANDSATTESAPPAEAEQAQSTAPTPIDLTAPRASSWRRSQEEPLPIEVPAAEKPMHIEARRFARLLVSEIKLYNEQKVQEGQAQGDIYERLREDIDRSRQMYDKRAAAPVAARYDYFHQELIKTLAAGDSDKLGSNYPGAIISA